MAKRFKKSKMKPYLPLLSNLEQVIKKKKLKSVHTSTKVIKYMQDINRIKNNESTLKCIFLWVIYRTQC